MSWRLSSTTSPTPDLYLPHLDQQALVRRSVTKARLLLGYLGGSFGQEEYRWDCEFAS